MKPQVKASAGRNATPNHRFDFTNGLLQAIMMAL
jgi:hypothetical protein